MVGLSFFHSLSIWGPCPERYPLRDDGGPSQLEVGVCDIALGQDRQESRHGNDNVLVTHSVGIENDQIEKITERNAPYVRGDSASRKLYLWKISSIKELLERTKPTLQNASASP